MTSFLRRPSPRAGVTVLLSVVLAVGCTVLYSLDVAGIEDLEYRLTDHLEAGAGVPAGSGRVVVVDIDEPTLAAVGQWPWPRHRLARLLDAVARMGASAIALDVVLAEPDQTSLARVRSSLHNELGVESNGLSLPEEFLDNDAILARTLAGGPFVLAHQFLFDGATAGWDTAYPPPSLPLLARGSAEGADLARVPEIRGLVGNLPQLCEAVSHAGFVNGRADSDGRLRRLPLVLRRGSRLYPGLGLAAIMRTLGPGTIRLDSSDLVQPVLTVGENNIPMDAAGNVRVRFRAGGLAVPHVSASHVLDGRAVAERFRGRIAFVGPGAAGLTEVFETPSGARVSAVEIHAQLAETLLARDYLLRPGWLTVVEILVTLAIAVGIGVAVVRLPLGAMLLTVALGLAGTWFGAATAFRTFRLAASPVLPGGVLVVNAAVLLMFTYWARQRDAQRGVADALALVRRSENQLSSILATIPDVVYRLDTEGRITFLSPAVRRYHADPGDFIGRPFLDLVAPGDRLAASYHVNERRTGRRATRDLELSLLLTNDGGAEVAGERHFSVSAEGVYSGETPSTRTFLGTQGIARDIEARRLLERQLAHARRMEAVGSLASGVAHDLNNILGALVGYPELLLLDLPPDSPMREGLEGIRQSGQRAAAIVQDMLTIARKGVRTREVIDVNEIVHAYLASAEFRDLKARHPQVEFATELTPGLMNVFGSPPHLSKVIMNAVANAAEAMPAGGRVAISTANRYLDARIRAYEPIPEGEYVRLSIVDEGVGIAAADLSRIFEPFYSTKKLGRSGSGLGMAVVWSTVKDHGGYLDVQSQEGVGTRFDFYFPVTRQEREEALRETVLQDYIGTERILVVDDVPEQLGIAVRMLSKLGYSVSGVSGGEQALALFETRPFDLVVLDMVMPDGIDGLETFQRIRTICPGQKAIIASGYSESDRVSSARELGAGAYLRKPYTLEAIGMAVRKELDRKTAATP